MEYSIWGGFTKNLKLRFLTKLLETNTARKEMASPLQYAETMNKG